MIRPTIEQVFIAMVERVNRYFIIMGIFFMAYFLMKAKVDIFLFLLALSYLAFALLSHKYLVITNRLAVELDRAKVALGDATKETREMHPR